MRLSPRVLALVASLFCSAAWAHPLMRLTVGGQHTLKVKGLHRITVENPEVADLRGLGPGEIVVLGIAPGHTTLILEVGPATSKIEVDVTPRAESVKVEATRATQYAVPSR